MNHAFDGCGSARRAVPRHKWRDSVEGAGYTTDRTDAQMIRPWRHERRCFRRLTLIPGHRPSCD